MLIETVASIMKDVLRFSMNVISKVESIDKTPMACLKLHT